MTDGVRHRLNARRFGFSAPLARCWAGRCLSAFYRSRWQTGAALDRGPSMAAGWSRDAGPVTGWPRSEAAVAGYESACLAEAALAGGEAALRAAGPVEGSGPQVALLAAAALPKRFPSRRLGGGWA